MSTTSPYGSGWRCKVCGDWVQIGVIHRCGGTSSSNWVPPSDARIADALERVAAALEKIAAEEPQS